MRIDKKNKIIYANIDDDPMQVLMTAEENGIDEKSIVLDGGSHAENC